MFVYGKLTRNAPLKFERVRFHRVLVPVKAEAGRMPWHDVAFGVVGPCVYDISEHFILRWNFIKRDKYKRHEKYDWLELRGRQGHDG